MTLETIALTLSLFASTAAIIGLLVTLFYFVFSETRKTRAEITRIDSRLASLEGRFQEWAPYTQQIVDILLKKSSNPDGEREELLKKWKMGTLNYQESIRLRDILAQEAEQAEEAWKTIIALGLLALFIYALTKKQ